MRFLLKNEAAKQLDLSLLPCQGRKNMTLPSLVAGSNSPMDLGL